MIFGCVDMARRRRHKRFGHKRKFIPYEKTEYDPTELPFTCKFCGNQFDSKHRLPENHNCEGLKKWKIARNEKLLSNPTIKSDDLCAKQDCNDKALYRCEYCNKGFCSTHKDPKVAMMRNAVDAIKDREERLTLYEEIRREDAHPCWVYNKAYFSGNKNISPKRREEEEEAIIEKYNEN